MFHYKGIVKGKEDASPCKGNTTDFPKPMKFKVYVCTDKEEHEGLCDPCTTEACYYKGKILYSIFWNKANYC